MARRGDYTNLGHSSATGEPRAREHEKISSSGTLWSARDGGVRRHSCGKVSGNCRDKGGGEKPTSS